MPEATSTQWVSYIQDHPESHLLQTPQWGKLKSQFGWSAKYVINGNAGAQILFRQLPLGFSIAYIAKGPLGPREEWKHLFSDIDGVCREKKAVFLKIEPDAWENEQNELTEIFQGYAAPSETIQPRRTIEIPIDTEPEEWLKAMKQKTRYNIRLAMKKDVRIIETSDLDLYQLLMDETGERDGFGVHSSDYYSTTFNLFHPNHCTILLATYDEEPLAAVILFNQGSRAWYFYGASSNRERNRMPTYLLQYEAMKWAKERGCTTYDLWGIPDYEFTDLESQFNQRSDGLWGVYRFKRGFGGNVLRSSTAFDRPYKPLLYKVYQLYRKFQKARTES